MTRTNLARQLFILSVSVLVSGCLSGGGSGGSDGGGGQTAGISGTGDSVGTVNGFGSVIVNGVRFDTSDADVFIDGIQGSQDDLEIGMVVIVNGDIEGEFDGTARRIDFDHTLQGPVEAVDQETGEITAVGLTIQTDKSTVFLNTSLANIVNGEVILVSGYHAPNGVINASYIQELTGAPQTQVDAEGFVQALNAPGRRFQIGNLQVEYSTAVINEENAVLAEGALVEVVGTRTAPGADLIANQITVLNGSLGNPGADLNLEGIVNSYVDNSNFRIGTQPIDIGTATDKDLTDEVPGDGQRMHVQGSIDDSGTLVAHRYYVIPENNYRISARLDFVSDSFNQFQLFNQVHWFLIITQFEDSSLTNNPSYGPADLAFGDYIIATGYRGNPGNPDQVVAARIERIDDPGFEEISGPLDSFDAGNMTLSIGNLTIQADCDAANVTCEDRNGIVVGNAAFYADLQPGDRLQTLGDEVGNQLNATTVRHN